MKSLSIYLESESLEALKREFHDRVPNIKSSHRCEALARSFGFKTYASLRASIRTSGRVSGADHVSLCDYLTMHGFNIDPVQYYLAVTKVSAKRIRDQNPELTLWGFENGRQKRKSDGTWETSKEISDRLSYEREELLSDYNLKSIMRCLALLELVPKTKTIRPGSNSYRLKHLAENYTCSFPDGSPLGPDYVANGAFITAALLAGFHHKRHIDDFGYFSVNATFNMSKKILDDLDCELRPDGALAEARRRTRKMKAFPNQMFRI